MNENALVVAEPAAPEPDREPAEGADVMEDRERAIRDLLQEFEDSISVNSNPQALEDEDPLPCTPTEQTDESDDEAEVRSSQADTVVYSYTPDRLNPDSPAAYQVGFFWSPSPVKETAAEKCNEDSAGRSSGSSSSVASDADTLVLGEHLQDELEDDDEEDLPEWFKDWRSPNQDPGQDSDCPDDEPPNKKAKVTYDEAKTLEFFEEVPVQFQDSEDGVLVEGHILVRKDSS